METGSRAAVDSMMQHSEEAWGHLDTLFDAIEAEGRWSDKHGEDWVFADLPYHFGYCERELVARVLELGPDMPEEERWEVRSISPAKCLERGGLVCLNSAARFDKWNRAAVAGAVR